MRKYSKGNILYTWMKSYICIGLAVLIAVIPVFYVSFLKLNEQNSNIYKYILRETGQIFDTYIGELKSCVYSLAHFNVDEKFNINQEDEGERQFAVYENRDAINNILNVNSNVSNAAIYYIDSGNVISTGGLFSDKEYFKTYYDSQSDEDFEYWKTMITGKDNFFLCKTQGEKKFVYKVNMANFLVRPRKNVIVFSEINQSAFLNKIKSVYDETESNIIIHDKITGSELSIFDYDSYDKEDYYSFHVKSNEAVITYTLAIKKSNYHLSLFFIEIMMVLSLMVVFLIIYVFAIFFSNKNYLPIKKILKPYVNETDFDESTNELEFLQKLIRHMNTQNIVSQKKFVLSNIVNDVYTDEDVEKFFEHYKFVNEEYIVAVVKPEESSIEKLKNNGYTKQLIQVIFVNIIEELLSKDFSSCVTEINNNYCCIINSEKIFDLDKIKSIFEDAAKSIYEHFGIEFIVGVGEQTTGYEGIGKSYSEAMKLTNFSNIKKKNKIMFFSEFRYDYDTVSQIINRMINSVRNFEIEECKSIFDSFVDDAASQHIPNEYILLQGIGIISDINEFVVLTDEGMLTREYNLEEYFSQCKTSEELKSLAHQYFDVLKAPSFDVKYNKKMIDVCAYVQKNYSNPNLSVSMIGDEFSMHPVYLSRIFKEETGQTLMEYIRTIRIEKAKELLKNTSININEIAEKTGYANIQSFSRAFKKIEGISPTVYKNTCKDNEE